MATAPAARRSLGYAASYPTPDLPDMECGCQEVGPFNYDPNTETGAQFLCDGRDANEYKKAGGWSIKNTDKCELFCSEGRLLFNPYPYLINISLAHEPETSIATEPLAKENLSWHFGVTTSQRTRGHRIRDKNKNKFQKV